MSSSQSIMGRLYLNVSCKSKTELTTKIKTMSKEIFCLKTSLDHPRHTSPRQRITYLKLTMRTVSRYWNDIKSVPSVASSGCGSPDAGDENARRRIPPSSCWRPDTDAARLTRPLKRVDDDGRWHGAHDAPPPVHWASTTTIQHNEPRA